MCVFAHDLISSLSSLPLVVRVRRGVIVEGSYGVTVVCLLLADVVGLLRHRGRPMARPRGLMAPPSGGTLPALWRGHR
jgi:hypothetical protein